MVQLSHPYTSTGKTIGLARWTFVGKVMSLLLNILSRFVIAFLPRSKCLLISWLQLPSEVILEPRKIKSVTVSIVFPSICHEVLRILLGLKLFTGCPWHKEWNQTLIMAHKTVSGLLLLFSLAVPLPQWSFSSSTRPSSFRSWGLEICSTLLWYL